MAASPRVTKDHAALLADVTQSILAHECRARLAYEAAAVSRRIRISVVAVIGVSVVTERRGCDRAGSADGATNDAGRDVTRPEGSLMISTTRPEGSLMISTRI